jgi:hypothetical protein
MGSTGSMMQADVIFAGPPMPADHGIAAPITEKVPETFLIGTRCPDVGELNQLDVPVR